MEVITMGKEFSFERLLTSYPDAAPDPQLIERIKGRGIKSMLDIGCHTALGLLSAYYSLGVDHIEGVDECSPEDVVKHYNEQPGKPHQPNLEGIWNTLSPATDDPNPVKITDYESVLRVSYSTDIVFYKPELEKYDLIVLSNVVHYWSTEQFVYVTQLIRRLSHPKTAIYIRIRPDHPMDIAGRMDKATMIFACRVLAAALGLKRYVHKPSDKKEVDITFTNL